MSEAEILELTYFDLCTIKRKQKVKNPSTGITENIEIVVADNIKCALSHKSVSNINGEIGTIVSAYELFINPLVNVFPGDTFEVTNKIGEKAIYLASKPKYCISHKNIPLTEKERV